MRFLSIALSFAFTCPLSVFAQMPAGPPTVAEAKAFLDNANAELLTLTSQAQRADWVGETHITDDTEALDALVNQQVESRTLEVVSASHRFDKLPLSADLRRQML